VVQVDVRGSTGYGRGFREAFLGDFAGRDLDDIASAAAYVAALPYVDGERMGIWGSSYGGTLTIYTLLKKPGLFHAGAAAAAAVDPRFFGTDDVAIVRYPEALPDAFANRAEKFAANLQDHLLIIHGMQDQVVPFKTTAVLAEALMREGKTFEFAFAAGATHAWSREAPYSRYLFGRMLQHFDRYLAP
jgi:dipeptidyl-peptidase-4